MNIKAFRTPCQSFHTIRTSQTSYATPEKLVKVKCTSGVKCTPIQKQENKFKNYDSNTITKGKQKVDLYEYITELESKINKLEQHQFQSLSYNSPQIQELEKRVLTLLNENCQLKSDTLAMQKLIFENEQLKSLVQDQQQKILEFGEQYNQLFDSHQTVCDEYRILESKIQQYEIGMSMRKHSSFSEYFRSAE